MACYFNETFLVMLLCIILPSFSADETRHFNSTSDRELLISSYEESLQIVHEASLHSSQQQSTPSSKRVFTFLRQTESETLEIARAAEVFQTTLQVLKNRARQRHKRNVMAPEILSREDVKMIAELSQCLPETQPAICQHSHHNKYRSITGLCNNRQNPLWGAANTPLVRWLPAEYEDGEREPKGWNRGRLHNGFQLPSPREVSKKILRSSHKQKDDLYSKLLVEWGQYLDHDITFTPQTSGSMAFWTGIDCLITCENMHPCFPIETDDIISGGCMPFYRSTPACIVNSGSDIGPALQRQQMNAITSFVDASVVYGHTPKLQSYLRDLRGLNGKLAVNTQFKDPKGRPYLPFIATLPSACHQDPQGERVECFSAGDTRANEGLPLASLHTLWLREHNRIAEALKHINGHWSPETIYQETRKIIGALHQIITMRDYVPKIIGQESFEQYIGPYGGYDPTTDPSASNVFATAAFRFGHATISPVLRRLNESFQEHESFSHLRLHTTFFSPWRIVKEGGIEPVLRGIIGTAAAVSSDFVMTEELTEKLVILNIPQHMDLASLNLQRGRDHALPGYNDWRSFCGLKRIETLDDLKETVRDGKVAEKLFEIYKHLDNIDVWLGGLIENLLPGARTGPLFACLIGKQMKALRDGDRFWWEAEGMFSQQQKAEILKGSLSRIICDNSDIREVPADSFMFRKYPSDYISCDHLPSMNLEAWREEKSQDLEQCGTPRKIKNGDFILSSTSGKLVAEYSCYHGFKLKGAAAIDCEGNRWSDQPPQCTGIIED